MHAYFILFCCGSNCVLYCETMLLNTHHPFSTKFGSSDSTVRWFRLAYLVLIVFVYVYVYVNFLTNMTQKCPKAVGTSVSTYYITKKVKVERIK